MRQTLKAQVAVLPKLLIFLPALLVTFLIGLVPTRLGEMVGGISRSSTSNVLAVFRSARWINPFSNSQYLSIYLKYLSVFIDPLLVGQLCRAFRGLFGCGKCPNAWMPVT